MRWLIIDGVCQAFDKYGEILAIVLHMSNTFNMILHAVLIHKLKAYKLSGGIFNLIQSLLSNRVIKLSWTATLPDFVTLMRVSPRALCLGQLSS